MALEWNPLALPSVFSLLLAWVAAAVVYFTAPGYAANRRLAVLLFLDGTAIGTASGLQILMGAPEHAYAWRAVSVVCLLAAPWVYLLFLATLDTPVTRPFQSKIAQRLLLSAAMLTPLLFFVFPGKFVIGMMEGSAFGRWAQVRGPWGNLTFFALTLVSLYGLVASLIAFRAAPDRSAARARAKAYSIAFGVRDAITAVVQVGLGLMGMGVAGAWLAHGLVVLAGLMPGIFVVLVTYGILRTQLFDLDVRIKQAIRRGAVPALLLGVYVVTNQLVPLFAPEDMRLFFGIATGALLVLAILPLQRLGDRVADATMPHVEPTGEYVHRRKLEVYRAAAEGAVDADGAIPAAQAHVLAALRVKLGITDAEHEVVLHEVREAVSAPSDGLDFRVGARVMGRYRIVQELGQGAFGTTYLATDETLSRQVVIKVLHADAARDPARLREARALAAVRHPNVVTLYDVEKIGDQAFVVMEHAEGGSLADRLKKGPLPHDAFERVSLQLLDGLHAVHSAGIVHRDVKPANVLLTADGQTKLADFGVARTPDAEGTLAGGAALTLAPIGTLRYMSPEQARGKPATFQSDLYAAAATLYETFTGHPYVEVLPNESAVEMQMRVARGGRFTGLDDAPSLLREWFATALDADPDSRFADARRMRDVLAQALASSRT